MLKDSSEDAYRMVSHRHQTKHKNLTVQYPIQSTKSKQTEQQITYNLRQLEAHAREVGKYRRITLTKPTTKYSHGSGSSWQTNSNVQELEEHVRTPPLGLPLLLDVVSDPSGIERCPHQPTPGESDRVEAILTLPPVWKCFSWQAIFFRK